MCLFAQHPPSLRHVGVQGYPRRHCSIPPTDRDCVGLRRRCDGARRANESPRHARHRGRLHQRSWGRSSAEAIITGIKAHACTWTGQPPQPPPRSIHARTRTLVRRFHWRLSAGVRFGDDYNCDKRNKRNNATRFVVPHKVPDVKAVKRPTGMRKTRGSIIIMQKSRRTATERTRMCALQARAVRAGQGSGRAVRYPRTVIPYRMYDTQPYRARRPSADAPRFFSFRFPSRAAQRIRIDRVVYCKQTKSDFRRVYV
jgi:hypothetical protein